MLTSFNRPSPVTSIILFACLSTLGIVWMITSQNTLLKEYPRVELGYQIVGKVVSTEVSKSIVRIQLENRQKFTIPAARNYDYSPSDLNEFLKLGDHINKRQGSDTLLISRNGEQYFFRLGKFIGMPSGAGPNIPAPNFGQ